MHEIDSVLGLNFSSDDFFALIRSCYNKRAENSTYRRLTFTLLGVANPRDLITDKNRTPFNIGRAIHLKGFDIKEAKPLLLGLSGKVSNPKAVLKQILYWTGGQPFLTQKLCQISLKSCEQGINTVVKIPPGNESLWVEQLVHSQIVDNWEAKDEPEHLKTIRDRLLRNEQKTGRLLGIYQQILQKGRVEGDDSDEQIDLLLSGLVVKDNEGLEVRNPTYAAVFKLDWVTKQLSKLRPYAETFNAWLNSGCSDESRLLRGQALQEAQNWSAHHSLSDQDYQFLTASQELDKREIQKSLEAERTKEVEARLAEQKQHTKRQNFFLFTISTALILASWLGMTTSLQYRKAIRNEIQAISRYSEALFALDKKLDALIEAIKARQNLQKLNITDTDIANIVESVLRQSVYGVVEYNRLSGHEGGVRGVAFSPNGKMIASASGDKKVRIWTKEGELLNTLEGHNSVVFAVQFSPNGELIASASGDSTIKLWKVDGTLLNTLSGHKGGIWGIAFSPDGEMIASASWDRTVKLWKRDGTLLKTFRGHKGGIWGIAFSPDGETIASASVDTTVKLWHRDGTLKQTLKGHNAGVRSVAFSPDGETIASGSWDRTVKLWERDGRLKQTLKSHNAAVFAVAFSSDSELLASASVDNTVQLWHRNGDLCKILKGHNSAVWSIAFSPDIEPQLFASDTKQENGHKNFILASASWDNTVKLWKLDDSLLKNLEGHRGGVFSSAISSDGQLIATGSDDQTVKIWQRDGTLLKTLEGHNAGVKSVVFSRDSKLIASAGDDQTVKIWQRDGTLLKTLGGHNAGVWKVVFSPDGEIIASASIDNTIKLWQLDGRLISTLKGHRAGVFGLAFSSDGAMIASTSGDNTIKLWQRDGRLITTLKGHNAAIFAIAFSPDGKMIATASLDNTVKLWQTDSILRENPVQTTLTGHKTGVFTVAFSPDGKMIATGDGNKTIRLWHKDGILITTLKGHSDRVRDIVFSPDSQMLISAGDDQKVILWQLKDVVELEQLLTYGCHWVEDYLRTNAEFTESDRHLCDDI